MRAKGDNATYIGHELAKCRDFTSLRFRLPFEKVGAGSFDHPALRPTRYSCQGLIVDWDAQKAIWDGLFSNEALAVSILHPSASGKEQEQYGHGKIAGQTMLENREKIHRPPRGRAFEHHCPSELTTQRCALLNGLPDTTT